MSAELLVGQPHPAVHDLTAHALAAVPADALHEVGARLDTGLVHVAVRGEPPVDGEYRIQRGDRAQLRGVERGFKEPVAGHDHGGAERADPGRHRGRVSGVALDERDKVPAGAGHGERFRLNLVAGMVRADPADERQCAHLGAGGRVHPYHVGEVRQVRPDPGAEPA